MSDKKDIENEVNKLFEKESAFEKLKQSFKVVQYKKESLIYKVLYDKYFRPKRYEAIIKQQISHKNINEFRSFIAKKYDTFPDIQFSNTSNENIQNSTELVERDFLNYYNKIYKVELFVYFWLGQIIFYMGASILTKTMNKKIALGLIFPGFFANIYTIYARNVNFRKYEEKLKPEINEDLEKYRRFFSKQLY